MPTNPSDTPIATSAANDRWSLDGRVAFVTGAGGGLGIAIVEMLARAGATVVCADFRTDGAELAAEAVDATGAVGRAVAIDVTSRDAVAGAVADAYADYGRLDVLCNLAGIAGSATRVVDLVESEFDAMFAVHFKGTLFACQAAIEPMRATGGGSIINMSSAAIDLAPATIVSYSVAKASIAMLTRTLASEVGADAIRVNAIAPSLIPTELSMQRMKDAEARQKYLDSWANMAPLGRVGTPEDVAAQVLYLASDASSFVTGQILRANGGIAMPW